MRVYYRRHKFKGRKWIERLEGYKGNQDTLRSSHGIYVVVMDRETSKKNQNTQQRETEQFE